MSSAEPANCSSLREEFQEFFADEGGIASAEFIETFPHGTLANAARVLSQGEAAAFCAGLAAKGVHHTVYVDVLQAPGLNAVAATPRPGVSFIGINLGTLLRTRILLDILNAQVHHLEAPVTDADTLHRVLRHPAPENEQWAFLREVGGRTFADTPESLPVLAHIQWAFALDFIYSHEMNHAMLGHTQYAARELGLERLHENHAPPAPLEKNLRRLMELRADYASGRILGMRLPERRYLLFPAIGHEVLAVDEWMANATFALTALLTGFNISWTLDPTSKLFVAHSHPHPEFRFRAASDGVISALSTFPDPGLRATWFHSSAHLANSHCKNAYRAILGAEAEFALQPGPAFYIPSHGHANPHPHLFSTDAEVLYKQQFEAIRTLDQQTPVIAYLE